MKEVKCDFCGSSFKRYKSQLKENNYCSTECQHNSQTKKEEHNCEECGEKVFKQPARVKEQVYCSKECMGKSQRNKVKVECTECGDFFKRQPSQISPRNFCTQECQRKNYSQKVTIKCDVCNSEVERSPSHVREHVFCSDDCWGEWFSENKSGENHHRWKGGGDRQRYYGPNWRKTARQVRKRDNYSCQRCGISQENLETKLDVHHKKPLKTFKQDGELIFEEANKKTNLISYCSKCHKIIEGQPNE